MTPESANLNEQPTRASLSFSATHQVKAYQLTGGNESEVLQFLRERPLHTVVMSGFIRDNGLDSQFNRGTFYAYRNEAGTLAGVSLIGHATFIEARCDDALREFARLARDFRSIHMIMGEQEMIRRFWKYYSNSGPPPRRLCPEVLYELKQSAETFAPVANLRPARLDELPLVVPVHAALAYEESGVNPLSSNPQGFQMRCRRRIERGRVWVSVERGQLIFKADVISDTPDVIYLEGVYVNPAERGKGFGSRCLSEMSRHLLRRTKSISVLVNEEHHQAQRFFQKLGFVPRGQYETIFC